MVIETVPKDILDKLNAGMEVSGTNLGIRNLSSTQDSVEVKQSTAANLNAAIVNAAGTALTMLCYGYSSGDELWFPVKIDADGHLQINIV